MTENEQLINTFYSAFQRKDYGTMQSCYADEATFTDAVFIGLDAQEVRAMWEMLCKNGKDLTLTYENIKESQNKVTADWQAVYTFSKTGNRVKNRIKAEFIIENGRIVSHKDQFNLYTWARQAFGATGWLIGWTDVFRAKIQSTAKFNLEKFLYKDRTS